MTSPGQHIVGADDHHRPHEDQDDQLAEGDVAERLWAARVEIGGGEACQRQYQDLPTGLGNDDQAQGRGDPEGDDHAALDLLRGQQPLLDDLARPQRLGRVDALPVVEVVVRQVRAGVAGDGGQQHHHEAGETSNSSSTSASAEPTRIGMTEAVKEKMRIACSQTRTGDREVGDRVMAFGPLLPLSY